MCFPSHNSSQGKQFNLAEFSEKNMSVCYVMIAYTSMKCFLASRFIEFRMAVSVRHRSLQYNLANMHLGPSEDAEGGRERPGSKLAVKVGLEMVRESGNSSRRR